LDKSINTNPLIKKQLLIEAKENFSYSNFSLFVEKIFDYFNAYLNQKISTIYQKDVINVHLPNLEKLADYCLLKESFTSQNELNILKNNKMKI
jgi:hypothetical protein